MPGPYSRSVTQPYQKPLATLDRSLPDKPLVSEVGLCLMPEFSTLQNTFEVDIHRNYLGLGFSITGGVDAPAPWTNLIRIKKIFPLQPAWETAKLKVGDIILKVSGVPLSSLNLRQALDILRTSPPLTCLQVCRVPDPGSSNQRSSPTNTKARSSIYRSYSYGPYNINTWENFKAAEQQELNDVRPFGDFNSSYPLLSSTGDSMEIEISPATPEKEWSPGDMVDNTSMVERNNSSMDLLRVAGDVDEEDNTMDLLRPVEEALRGSRVVGQFNVTLTKVNGSLGFSLQSTDDTVLNHTIKAIVREPALSDGQLKVGDKLVSANGVDLSSFSHQELIMFLRQTEDTVNLGLYRDNSRSQTPLDGDPAASPLPRGVSPGRKHLRYEAKELVRSLQSSRTSLEKAGLASQPGSYTSSGTLGRRRGRPFSPQLQRHDSGSGRPFSPQLQRHDSNSGRPFSPQFQTSYSGRPFSPQLQRPGSRGGVLLAAGSPVPTVESPVTSSAPPSLAVTQAMTALCLDDRLQIQEVDQENDISGQQPCYTSDNELTSSPILTSPGSTHLSSNSPSYYVGENDGRVCSVQILSVPSSPTLNRQTSTPLSIRENYNTSPQTYTSSPLPKGQPYTSSPLSTRENFNSSPLPVRPNNNNYNKAVDNSFFLQQPCGSLPTTRRPKDLNLDPDTKKQKRQGYIFSPANQSERF